MSAILIGWEPPEPFYCGDTSEQERAEEEHEVAQFMEWTEQQIAQEAGEEEAVSELDRGTAEPRRQDFGCHYEYALALQRHRADAPIPEDRACKGYDNDCACPDCQRREATPPMPEARAEPVRRKL